MQMDQNYCLRELRREIKRVHPTKADPLDHQVMHAASLAVVGMVLDATEPLHCADDYFSAARDITQQLHHYIEDRESQGWEPSPYRADRMLYNIHQAETLLLQQSITTWGELGKLSPSL